MLIVLVYKHSLPHVIHVVQVNSELIHACYMDTGYQISNITSAAKTNTN